MTIGEALRQAEAQLTGVDNPRLEAEVLLCHVLGVTRSHCYAWPEAEIEAAPLAQFQALCARRASGEPVAYLTGTREFWSLPLAVSPAVLIPRPDSELLVARALALIPADAAWHIVDLGTGSGALAIAVAHERPRCQVFALEYSPPALHIAKTNAQALGLRNLHCYLSDWWQALGDKQVDLALSNPPYIAEDDPHLSQGDVRFEPRSALTAAAQGLADLHYLIASSRVHLKPGAHLLLEHGYTQGADVRACFHAHGYCDIHTYQDLAGHARVSSACWAGM
jgi:release factor glutamine methyltransferase